MRPRIDGALARRIDALAQRAHRFHRFAHHPLCAEYAGELIRVGNGRMRVCRGCALAAVGLLGGLAAAIATRPPLAMSLTAAGLAFALVTVSMRMRASKVFTRLVPASGLGLALASGVAPAGAAFGVGCVLALAYRRRGPDRSPCGTCAERLGPAPCRGMAEITRAERAFQRLSGRWLMEGRTIPALDLTKESLARR